MHILLTLLTIGAIALVELSAQRDNYQQCICEDNYNPFNPSNDPYCRPAQPGPRCNKLKPRRYDIDDLGYHKYFHGWVDVQGQGAANDYCRAIGGGSTSRLSCALAGTNGKSEIAYESAWNFDLGYPNTWYMKDEDRDGRDDYCRCVGDDAVTTKVVCTKAGEHGFYGSKLQNGSTFTFTPTGNIDCKSRIVFPEFGRPQGRA